MTSSTGLQAERFEGTSCLVTGGLGFIGSNLARCLASLGARVTVVDALVPGTGANSYNLADLEGAIRLVKADLRDGALMQELVADQRYIFNLAGKVSHLDSMQQPEADLAANLQAHLSLLEACRVANPTTRILYASTRQVYGAPQHLPVDEGHSIQPTDINGVHKLAAEQYHFVYHKAYGMPTVSLRLTNVYGPRMPLNSDRHGVIGWFVRLALEAREISLYGDGGQVRDVCYVDDAVRAVLLALSTSSLSGQVLNVGGSEVVTLRALVEGILAAAGSGTFRMVPWPEDRQRIDIGGFYSDDRRFREATGWRPKVSLAEGLARTVRFYREHGEHYWRKSS